MGLVAAGGRPGDQRAAPDDEPPSGLARPCRLLGQAREPGLAEQRGRRRAGVVRRRRGVAERQQAAGRIEVGDGDAHEPASLPVPPDRPCHRVGTRARRPARSGGERRAAVGDRRAGRPGPGWRRRAVAVRIADVVPPAIDLVIVHRDTPDPVLRTVGEFLEQSLGAAHRRGRQRLGPGHRGPAAGRAARRRRPGRGRRQHRVRARGQHRVPLVPGPRPRPVAGGVPARCPPAARLRRAPGDGGGRPGAGRAGLGRRRRQPHPGRRPLLRRHPRGGHRGRGVGTGRLPARHAHARPARRASPRSACSTSATSPTARRPSWPSGPSRPGGRSGSCGAPTCATPTSARAPPSSTTCSSATRC